MSTESESEKDRAVSKLVGEYALYGAVTAALIAAVVSVVATVIQVNSNSSQDRVSYLREQRRIVYSQFVGDAFRVDGFFSRGLCKDAQALTPALEKDDGAVAIVGGTSQANAATQVIADALSTGYECVDKVDYSEKLATERVDLQGFIRLGAQVVQG